MKVVAIEQKRKSINRITLLNICSTFLIQGIAFLTIPVFTRLLGAEQFGIYSVFHSWSTLFTCVLGLGVSNSVGNGFYYFKDRYIEFRNSILVFGTIISILLISSGLMALRFLNLVPGYSLGLTALLLTTSFGRFILNFVQNACVYEKRAELNFFVSIVTSVSSVILSLIFISYIDKINRYLGKIAGECLVYFIVALGVGTKLFCERPIGIRIDYCRFGLKIGFPVIFHSFAHSILTQSDRVMMQNMGIDNVEIGIYSFYYTFVSVLLMILSALNTSWCPFYYDDLDNKNREILKKRSANYIELFTVIVCGFLLLSREVSYILAGKEYRSGMDIMPILVISVYFVFMYQSQVNFEMFHKKTKIVAIGTSLAALINILLNFILIPKYRIYGAVVATGISYFMLFVLHFIIVKCLKGYDDKPEIKRFVLGMFIVLGISSLFYILKDFWYLRWTIGVLLGVFELRKLIERKSIF